MAIKANGKIAKSARKKPVMVSYESRVQITLRFLQGWVICLKIPRQLHKRIKDFEQAMKCDINERFKDVFDGGIISEEIIDRFLFYREF
jgi:hypothetical protein